MVTPPLRVRYSFTVTAQSLSGLYTETYRKAGGLLGLDTAYTIDSFNVQDDRIGAPSYEADVTVSATRQEERQS